MQAFKGLKAKAHHQGQGQRFMYKAKAKDLTYYGQWLEFWP